MNYRSLLAVPPTSNLAQFTPQQFAHFAPTSTWGGGQHINSGKYILNDLCS